MKLVANAVCSICLSGFGLNVLVVWRVVDGLHRHNDIHATVDHWHWEGVALGWHAGFPGLTCVCLVEGIFFCNILYFFSVYFYTWYELQMMMMTYGESSYLFIYLFGIWLLIGM